MNNLSPRQLAGAWRLWASAATVLMAPALTNAQTAPNAPAPPAVAPATQNAPSPVTPAPVPFVRLDQLPLDQLIDLLPTIENQYSRDPAGDAHWTFHPVAQEMKRRVTAGTELSAAQWQRAFDRSGAIRFPKKWPASQPVAISTQEPAWLPFVMVTLAPIGESKNTLYMGSDLWETCGNAAEGRRRGQMQQTLGTLPLGRNHVEFIATMKRGEYLPANESGKPGVFWTGRVGFDVEIVPTLDEAMPPVKDEATGMAVRQSIGVCVRDWGGAPKALFVIDPDLQKYPSLKTLALSIRLELLRDGVVQSTGSIVLSKYDSLRRLNSMYKDGDPMFAFALIDSLPVGVKSDAAEAAHWSLRLTGTNEDVLDLRHADKYWAGSVTVSVVEALKLEKDRTQGKPERSFVWMP